MRTVRTFTVSLLIATATTCGVLGLANIEPSTNTELVAAAATTTDDDTHWTPADDTHW
jgi:hypothetical protein